MSDHEQLNTTSQQISELNPDDKLGQITVMASGGAFLGCAVGQLPGAILGSLAALGYGVYVNFVKSP